MNLMLAPALFGYLSGSVLYARVFAGIFGKEKMIEKSRDKNPGAANAFLYGGFACGMLTLICDICKGFFPVFLFVHDRMQLNPGIFQTALVIAAPVVGHIFPLFYRFKGGKGIAVTFGCLLGLFPVWQPFAVLAICFIFLSIVVCVTPHYYRTLAAYFCSMVGMILFTEEKAAIFGFLIICGAVFARMMMSSEEKEKLKVRLLWMH